MKGDAHGSVHCFDYVEHQPFSQMPASHALTSRERIVVMPSPVWGVGRYFTKAGEAGEEAGEEERTEGVNELVKAKIMAKIKAKAKMPL